MFSKLVMYFVPSGIDRDPEDLRKYKLIISTIIITFLFLLEYLVLCWIIRFPIAILVHALVMLWFLPVLFMIRNGMNKTTASNLYILAGVIDINVSIYFSGGMYSPVIPFLASSPIVALLLAGKPSGFFWMSVNTLCAVAFCIMSYFHFPFPDDYDLNRKTVFFLLCFIGIIQLIFILSLVFENGKNAALNKLAERNKMIVAEKQKSEMLLLNILPEEISNELKQTGKTRAHSYDMATVMFSDFVNFTSIGEKLTPEELVSAIAEYFETFDHIIERYGIEKIKTVGDAYICASGLPIPTTDNALIMIRVAFDFLKAMEELNEKRHIRGHVVFNIRIGINTGPLVAGVVGIKKFAYDIWGDTVNTAARLQEKGEAGRINISGSTYDLIKQIFPCTYRGKIEAKNKGQIDMYFVEGLRQNVLV
ncbi:MAG: adenylate/guanylate cyclase domain-containing protein [Chitinophagaceae bacterium]|nr:MAG: adenylate/guanylate cyclase domain-containing protein [Chitinophagaceae bacterium]